MSFFWICSKNDKHQLKVSTINKNNHKIIVLKKYQNKYKTKKNKIDTIMFDNCMKLTISNQE